MKSILILLGVLLSLTAWSSPTNGIPSVKRAYQVTCSDCGAKFKAHPDKCQCHGGRALDDGQMARFFDLQFKCAQCGTELHVEKEFYSPKPSACVVEELEAPAVKPQRVARLAAPKH